MSTTRWYCSRVEDLRGALAGIAPETPIRWFPDDDPELDDPAEDVVDVHCDGEASAWAGLTLVVCVHYTERPEQAHLVEIGPGRGDL